MNTPIRARRFTELDARGWVDKRVKINGGDRVGVVTGAHPSGDGKRIILYVWNGSYSFQTDTEHASRVTTK